MRHIHLRLADDPFPHQHVHPHPPAKLHLVIDERHSFLALVRDAPLRQLAAETPFVCPFQQARAQVTVHGNAL
jgi:hypothetical protein